MGKYYYLLGTDSLTDQQFVVGPYPDEATARESAEKHLLVGTLFTIESSSEKDLPKAIVDLRKKEAKRHKEPSNAEVKRYSNGLLFTLLAIIFLAGISMGFALAVLFWPQLQALVLLP